MEHLNSKLINLKDNHKEKKDKLEMRKKDLERAVSEIARKNIRLGI